MSQCNYSGSQRDVKVLNVTGERTVWPVISSVSPDERLYHTVSCLSDSLALVVGGRTSPSNAALGMLWLRFPKTCNDSDPSNVTVEPVSLQPAAEPAALRWRHSTTEVIFKGKKVGKSGDAFWNFCMGWSCGQVFLCSCPWRTQKSMHTSLPALRCSHCWLTLYSVLFLPPLEKWLVDRLLRKKWCNYTGILLTGGELRGQTVSKETI